MYCILKYSIKKKSHDAKYGFNPGFNFHIFKSNILVSIKIFLNF